MRYVLRALTAGSIWVLLLVGLAALSSPAAAARATGGGQGSGVGQGSQAAPVRLIADLACLRDGGAEATFTIRNLRRAPLTIDGDFHLGLEPVRAGGRAPGPIVFVFPAPGFGVIPPGEERTFVVPMGDAEPGSGEPGVDLSARRLVLGAEVFLEGRDRPVRRHFSFPGCRTPAS